MTRKKTNKGARTLSLTRKPAPIADNRAMRGPNPRQHRSAKSDPTKPTFSKCRFAIKASILSAGIRFRNLVFDTTPIESFDAIYTENGALTTEQLNSIRTRLSAAKLAT